MKLLASDVDAVVRPLELWLPAMMWENTVGAPSHASAGSRWRVWSMPNALDSQVNCTTFIPSVWNNYTVDLYWTNLGAGAGNVLWNLTSSNRANTQDLSAGDTSLYSAVIAAPAQSILKMSRLNQSAVAPLGGLSYFRITRTASDASDTLTNAIGFLGLLLTRAA